MSDMDRNYATGASPFGRAASRDTAAVDAGLRSYMLRIYNYMTIGLAITGAAALGVYILSAAPNAASAVDFLGSKPLTAFGAVIFKSPLRFAFMFAPLVMVMVLSFGINRLAPATAQLLFWVFSALMGISLSSILFVFTGQSIAQVFFVTAAAFGALSLYGYTTQRSLSGMGSFLMMGLFGLIIAGIVNIWLQSGMLYFVYSVIGVLIFAGLTAYDTQRLKSEYIYGYTGAGDIAEKSAIMGALSLYLNFINMFTLLLNLLGQRD